MKRRGILICLCGPAGVGKSALGERLVSASSGSLQRSVSCTTRTLRGDEKDGQDYIFLSKDVFQKLIDDNSLYEWEEVHGNFYGTPRENIERSVDAGQDLLLIIDIRGSLSIKRALPDDCVVVFLSVDSFSVLEERLKKRGDTRDLELRLKTAREEFDLLESTLSRKELVDYVVINEDFDQAFQSLSSILKAERLRVGRNHPKLPTQQSN